MGSPRRLMGHQVLRIDDIDALERAVEAALARGHVVDARDALAAAWPRLVATAGPRVRALLVSLPDEAWQADAELMSAMGASYLSVDSLRAAAALPWGRAAELLLDRTPADAVVRATVLSRYAASLRAVGRLTSATTRAHAAWTALADDIELDALRRVAAQATAATQLGLCHLHAGDHRAAADLLRIAVDLDDAAVVSDRLEALGGLAVVAVLLGDDRTARSRSDEAITIAERDGLDTSRTIAPALIARLMLSIDTDSSDDDLAVRVDRTSWDTDWHPIALAVLASWSGAQGSRVEALELAGRAIAEASAWEGSPAVVEWARGIRGSAFLALGDRPSAARALELASPSPDHVVCSCAAQAATRLAAGDATGALEIIVTCDLPGAGHAARPQVELLVVAAAAHDALGESGASDVALDRALALAHDVGVRSPLAHVAHATARHLLERAASRRHPDAVARLVREVAASIPAAAVHPAESLSEREMQIAERLAGDESTSEIAAALFISSNTVKTHLRSIYRKLEVSTRRDAVREFRERESQPEITPH